MAPIYLDGPRKNNKERDWEEDYDDDIEIDYDEDDNWDYDENEEYDIYETIHDKY